MPEGPELKVACDTLNEILVGSEIKNLNILSGRYYPKEKFPDKYIEFQNLLPLTITKIGVKGKLLYFIFNNNWVMLNTFGMTGRWTLNKQKHCHIELEFDDKKIWFCDVRRFGTIKLLDKLTSLDKKLSTLGPDILNSDISAEEFVDIVWKHKNKNITKVLMNQSIISGCGNYLKSEALYKSKISPHHIIENIDRNKLIDLFNNLKQTMIDSYRCQEASISSYYTTYDQKGTYVFRFLVYGRDNDDLGNMVIRERTLDGRTSHWVKNVQI